MNAAGPSAPASSPEIALAGAGWGCVAAFQGLAREFPAIEVLSDDPDVLALLRPDDRCAGSKTALTAKTVVCAGYPHLIRLPLLGERDFINLHYSLLPRFRGRHSTVWAILEDEPVLGLTLHRMNEQLDDGAILYQYEVPNDGETSAPDYMRRFNDHIAAQLGHVMRDYLEGRMEPAEQDRSQASCFPARTPEDCRLDCHRSHRYLKNFFRALQLPYPRPFIEHGGERLTVTGFRLLDDPSPAAPGIILATGHESLRVKTATGAIELRGLLDAAGNPASLSGFRCGACLDSV